MLPQFNVVLFPTQLFWLILCFSALYFFVTYFIIPEITIILTERQRRMDDDIEKANYLKTQIEASVKKYEQILSSAKEEANIILHRSQDEVIQFVQSQKQEVARRLATEIQVSEERIATAKKAALEQIQEIACGITEDIIKQLVSGFAIDRNIVASIVQRHIYG